jgi:predicted SprT family Zn-dependent metalloprotease
MKGQITLQSAIDELQRMFRLLNKTYFNGELERPVIAILTDTTSGAYGWISVNKVWSSKDNAWFREINLCAEHLNRPVELVITTLMHEMCHLLNIQRGVQDTSRGGTYHNQKFKEVAESRGLVVGKSDKYGFCITTPSDAFADLVKQNCRAGCFKLERAKTYRDGTPKVTTTGADGKEKTVTRTKQSSRKYICAKCGVTVRATKEVNIVCGDCGTTMTTTE